MKVLIACEESQRVCIAFRERGHEAHSCDVLPCSGGRPEWHIQDDVRNILNDSWDLIIAHPPCTYLTITANRWYNVERYGDSAIQRLRDRDEAIKFFMLFVDAPCEKIAIENPIGIMSSDYRVPDQIIQPYMFGDPYEKKTCLWLKNLSPLEPTNLVMPEPRQILKSGKTMPTWYSNAPKQDRARIRSKTFLGIAKAMAEQWG